jgi:hypothetical protein
MRPITQREYLTRTEDEWLGRRVRSRVILSNRWTTMPAGTFYTITRKFAGFALKTDPCPHCGVEHKITKVPHHYLETEDD